MSASGAPSSIFSGPLSSAPSSNLSPRTPPPHLPPSQSLPSLTKGDGGRDRQDVNLEMGEPSIWEEEETVADYGDGYEEQPQSLSHVSGRKTPPRTLTTSVSMPTWDRSLDWNPRQGRKGARSVNNRSSIPKNSPESSGRALGRSDGFGTPQTQPPNADVLFPSLYDPPPANDLFEVSEDMSVGALMQALDALRSNEEKWRQECGRLGQECERIKWAWSEDVRKLHVKENEVYYTSVWFPVLPGSDFRSSPNNFNTSSYVSCPSNRMRSRLFLPQLEARFSISLATICQGHPTGNNLTRFPLLSH